MGSLRIFCQELRELRKSMELKTNVSLSGEARPV